MFEKMEKAMKGLRVLEGLYISPPSVGQVSRLIKMNKQTVKRQLEKAEKFGLVSSEMTRYKTTGKRVYYLRVEGIEFLEAVKDAQ